ncbi:hypothetical protein [Megalodesulfovibrio paquesii]
MTPFFRYPRPPRLAVHLVAAHLCLSLGGLLLHLRIHPVLESYFYWWAAAAGVVSCLFMPALFLHPRTVGLGCLLNALTVLLGTVGMAYFSLHSMTWPVDLASILLQSTLPDIIILLAKLPLGQMILETMRPEGPRPEGVRGCS